MVKLNFKMKNLNIIYLMFFLAMGCKYKTSENNYYTLKSIQIDSITKEKIGLYSTNVAIDKSIMYPIIVCKYYYVENNMFLIISQNERHNYFFTERGFTKNLYCNKVDSLIVITEIEQNLKTRLNLSIINNTECKLDFPMANFYISIVPDSVVPKVVKNNLKKDNKGWVSYHERADKWLYKLTDKGKIIDSSFQLKQGGVPILH